MRSLRNRIQRPPEYQFVTGFNQALAQTAIRYLEENRGLLEQETKTTEPQRYLHGRDNGLNVEERA